MILHSILLTLQTVVVVFAALIPFKKVLLSNSFSINFTITIVDLIVQMMVSYICYTMGSSVYLRKFQMTLDVSNGVPYVMFSRIRESFRNSDIIIEDSVEN